ncbi:MAG: hypothetical protein J5725_03560 [Bacteroidales bacterium]|nr:hypothetical protein [Bacteroidales bacterium]
MHDKANFVFRELNADDAIQIILKRSFRAGVPVLEVSSDGINLIVQRGLKGSTISSLRQWKDRYEGDKKQLLKDMRKDGGTWSSYDEQRAERQVKIQAIGTLKEAIEELKKKR